MRTYHTRALNAKCEQATIHSLRASSIHTYSLSKIMAIAPAPVAPNNNNKSNRRTNRITRYWLRPRQQRRPRSISCESFRLIYEWLCKPEVWLVFLCISTNYWDSKNLFGSARRSYRAALTVGGFFYFRQQAIRCTLAGCLAAGIFRCEPRESILDANYANAKRNAITHWHAHGNRCRAHHHK